MKVFLNNLLFIYNLHNDEDILTSFTWAVLAVTYEALTKNGLRCERTRPTFAIDAAFAHSRARSRHHQTNTKQRFTDRIP
jgi:hypothetical protein